MECNGCHQHVPDGATRCPNCDRVLGSVGAIATRSAATVVFRPEELGLPGSVPSHGVKPPDGPGIPPPVRDAVPPPRRRRRRGWIWALAAVIAVAVIGTGATLALRDRSPEDVVLGAADVQRTSPPRTSPPGTDPAGAAPAGEAEVDPAEAMPPTTSPGSPTSKPTPDGEEDENGGPAPSSTPAEQGTAAPLPTPIPVADGFLITASDARRPLPAPVLRTPTPAWEVQLPGEVAAVVGEGDLVVIISMTADGQVVSAVDAQSGTPRWNFVPSGTIVEGGVRLADTVVITVQGPDPGRTDIVGLDRATGEQRWRQQVETAGSRLQVSALPDGRTILSDLHHLALLDPATGQMQVLLEGGEVRLGRGIASSHEGDLIRVIDLADGNLVYELSIGLLQDPRSDLVFTRDRVVAYDGETIWSVSTAGRREWDHSFDDPSSQLHLLALLPDDRVLVSTDGPDGTAALDLTSGEVVWRSRTTIDLVGQFDGVLRGVDPRAGQVTLVDLADGDTVGTFLDASRGGSPYANGIYYGVDPDGLTAISLVDGRARWTVPVAALTDRHSIDGAVVAQTGPDRIALLR